MRKCIRCTDWKDESEFNIRNQERGYLQSVCRDCQKHDGRDRYANDTDRVKEINRLARQRSKKEAERYIYHYLSQSACTDCGEHDFSVLTFDHIKGQKRMNIPDMVSGGYSLNSIMEEVKKTEVVCFNCHMRREQKRRGSGRFEKFWDNG
jgi:hypothetical protein